MCLGKLHHWNILLQKNKNTDSGMKRLFIHIVTTRCLLLKTCFNTHRNYFKFVFIRSPPERILSAYRNKIEQSHDSNSLEQSMWDDIQSHILASYRNTQERDSTSYPTFSEFIKFLYDSDSLQMNEHYKMMTELCHPCAVHYHYIGNFATLRRDANAVLNHLNINSTLFWDRGSHYKQPTHSYLSEYYLQLDAADKSNFKEKYADDIAFYYYMFSLVANSIKV